MIYFTRHGESVANVADREWKARPEDADSLSPRGWEQARGVGERLRGEGIEAILASPYGRAQETAQAIGEVLGLPFDTDEDLHEVRQSDAYRAASPSYKGTGHVSWMPAHPPEHAEPGAESFSAILTRVANVQGRLEARLHPLDPRDDVVEGLRARLGVIGRRLDHPGDVAGAVVVR